MSLYDKLKEAGTEYVTWKIHTFTGSGTFQITSGSGKVDTLIVAGGGGAGAGGGGSNAGAGGGAGGMIYTIGQSISSGNHNVTVGTGGVGGIWSTTGSGYTSGVHAVNGLDSVFNGVTASGGGGGGQMSSTGGTANTDGNDGGSGGGGGISNGVGGTATSGQGNNGGSSAGNVSPYKGAGGGGAGAAGAAGSSGTGVGGAGLSNSITGNAVIYAGGGGGGGPYGNSASGSGNAMGGGGAGVAASGFGTNQGQSGKTGIVIIKYDSSNITATGGTVTTITEYTPMKQRMVETFSSDAENYDRWGASGDFGFSMADDIDGGMMLKWYNANPVAGREGILTTSDTTNGNKRQFSPTNFVWIANCKWTGTRTQGVSRFGIKRYRDGTFNGGGVAGATLGSDNAKISAYTTNETSGQISVVASTIDVDNIYHNYKGARSGGAYTLLIDGVTSVTETNGYLPVNASQPFLYCYNNDTTHHSLNCNYFEVYNT